MYAKNNTIVKYYNFLWLSTSKHSSIYFTQFVKKDAVYYCYSYWSKSKKLNYYGLWHGRRSYKSYKEISKMDSRHYTRKACKWLSPSACNFSSFIRCKFFPFLESCLVCMERTKHEGSSLSNIAF